MRTCHVAILEQSQITPTMLRIPTVQTEKPYWSYAKCFCLCLFTRNCRWICNSFPGLSRAKMALHNIPLNFLCGAWLGGFFSQESLWFLLTSCFKWEDLFILSWTISFLFEWMKSWFRRDSWIIFSAWLFPVIGLYMDRWFEYYSLSVEDQIFSLGWVLQRCIKDLLEQGGPLEFSKILGEDQVNFIVTQQKSPTPPPLRRYALSGPFVQLFMEISRQQWPVLSSD